MCTTTVLPLSTSGPLQTGRYVDLTALMMFFQLSMMCRHLIFYPNLDRNGEKKTLALILPWFWVMRQNNLLFSTGIPKEFYWHIRTLFESDFWRILFPYVFFRLEFLNDFDAILSTQLTKQVNPFWNCLKIPKEF